MEPIRRWPIKRQSRGLKETNRKSRSYRKHRDRPIQNQPEDVVGADIGVYRPDISEKVGGIDRTGNRLHGPTYNISHQRRQYMGPKAKYEIMRGLWVKELKDISLRELLKLFKKTFLPTRNVLHIRNQFFNVKKEDNETLDEHWKRLVDIERNSEFITISSEDIIIYKLAAPTNDKKARYKFIKSSLNLQLILETIESDNYNRNYGDKQTKSKRQQKNSPESTSEDQKVGYTKPGPKKKALFTNKKKIPDRNCHFCGKSNWMPDHTCPARKAKRNNC